MTKAVTLGTIATGAFIAAIAQPAYAQQPQSDAEGIQDIVVPARRTEESLQTTPIAVTGMPPAAQALTTRTTSPVVSGQITASGAASGKWDSLREFCRSALSEVVKRGPKTSASSFKASIICPS